MGNTGTTEAVPVEEYEYIKHTPVILPQLNELEAEFKGTIHKPGTESYTKQRRTVWIKSAGGYPSAIASAVCKEDVIAAVKFTSKHKVPLAIAGGRHSHLCMVNDSLVLDMAHFNTVKVNPDTKQVEVGAGAKLGKMDEECAKYNVAVPAGHNPDTGVAGLTLGGGFGYLTRKFGLTVDSLLSVEIVLANGDVVTADSKNHPDLFWAVRGGGGNFGVVLTFTFQGHSIPESIVAGLNVYLQVPLITGALLPNPRDVLTRARDYFVKAPGEVCASMVLPVGGPLVVLFACVGDLEQGQKEAAIFNQVGYTPISSIKPMSYHLGLQPIINDKQKPDYTYEKGVILSELSDELLDTLWELRSQPVTVPGIRVAFIIVQVGPGKMNSVGKCDTPFYHREAVWWILIAVAFDPTLDNVNSSNNNGIKSGDYAKQLSHDIHTKLSKFASSAYAAIPVDDISGEKNRLSTVYGENLPRLLEVKQKYDPTNLFRLNRNVWEGLAKTDQ